MGPAAALPRWAVLGLLPALNVLVALNEARRAP